MTLYFHDDDDKIVTFGASVVYKCAVARVVHCKEDQDAGAELHEVVARTRIGVKTFLTCLDDAKHQVEQSRADVGKRISFRRLPE